MLDVESNISTLTSVIHPDFRYTSKIRFFVFFKKIEKKKLLSRISRVKKYIYIKLRIRVFEILEKELSN